MPTPKKDGGGSAQDYWGALDNWAHSRVDWGQLDPARQEYIRENVVAYAQNHPGLFGNPDFSPNNPHGVSPHQLIFAINNPQPSSSGDGSSGTGSSGDGSSGSSGDGSSTAGKTKKPDSGTGGAAARLPGVRGKDFHLVRGPNGEIYAVYHVKAFGHTIPMAWRIQRSDYDTFGIKPGDVAHITGQAFQQLNVFGTTDEIARHGDGRHPWVQFLHSLKEDYGQVSWMHDKDYMATMLAGWFENTPSEELALRLRQTDWYKNRNEWERKWQQDLGPGDRKAQIQTTVGQMKDALEGLYGPTTPWQKYWGPNKLRSAAADIASGLYGDPTTGIQVWQDQVRRDARQIEGTQAWQDWEQQKEDSRAFANRPADMAEKLRLDAQSWLGPQGVPDQGTLKSWADRLVTNKASQSEWDSYMQRQAQSLYPWLGANERWQDRAGAYKNILEQQLNQPVKWGNPLLQQLGEKNDKGKQTGNAMSFDDFITKVRSTDQWWGSSTAKEEGFGLLDMLEQTFNGA